MQSEHRGPPSFIACATVNMPKRLVLSKSEHQWKMRTNSSFYAGTEDQQLRRLLPYLNILTLTLQTGLKFYLILSIVGVHGPTCNLLLMKSENLRKKT